MSEIKWITKHFNDLSVLELYKILQLRSMVFVVEQQCIFLDMDNNDQIAYHTLGLLDDGELVATTRLFNLHDSYEGYQSIGRVCCSSKYRNKGYGKALMLYSINECKRLFGPGSIKIGAQLYLNKFYNDLGFENCDDVYEEDGIPHIHMIRQ